MLPIYNAIVDMVANDIKPMAYLCKWYLMSVSIYILVIKCMHVDYSILSKYFLNCKYQD